MTAFLALALLLPCRPAPAQVDPNQLVQQNQTGDQPSAEPKTQTELGVLLNAAGAPGGVELRTGDGGVLRIGVDGSPISSAKEAPQQKPRDWTPLAIAVCCALFGVSLLFRKDGKAAAAVPPATMPPVPGGETLGQLAITRVIGQGGMGVVYEAVDRALDRRVALKKMREELRDRPADCAQFLSEAKTVAALHHPNIVEIHSIVQQAGEVYLVFEFVDGKTVAELLSERGRLELAQVKALLGPVCQALEFAHGHGVIHRDLKPSNVMIAADGAVKVMDFGIARRAKEALQAAGGSPAGPAHLTSTLVGTPLYMAPEAESGLLSAATDVYALGAMAYEMATGRPPFPPPASAAQKMRRGYAPASGVVPGLPPAFDALVDAALDPDPSRRLPSAAAFWQALAAVS